MVQEQVEPIAFEIGAITFQIVLAKLVNDKNDNQFWMGVVGAGQARNGS